MFQCIIQPRNGIIHNSGEMKGVFPGAKHDTLKIKRDKGIHNWSWIMRLPIFPSLIWSSDSGCPAGFVRLFSQLLTICPSLQNMMEIPRTGADLVCSLFRHWQILLQCWRLTQSGADDCILAFMSKLAHERAMSMCLLFRQAQMLKFFPFLFMRNAACFCLRCWQT